MRWIDSSPCHRYNSDIVSRVFAHATLLDKELPVLPDLAIALNRLEADMRGGVLFDRSALFWLKTFVVLAVTNDGVVRSDRWVEDGLVSA